MAMKNGESELTAYCGLYCGDCIRYRCRAADLSESLLDEIEKNHWLQYTAVKKSDVEAFDQFEALPKLLKALAELKCNTPCRAGGDGCGQPCAISACVKGKDLDGCWQCPDFETCDKLEFLVPLHGDSVRNNLRAIQQHGLENWAQHRDKCYP